MPLREQQEEQRAAPRVPLVAAGPMACRQIMAPRRRSRPVQPPQAAWVVANASLAGVCACAAQAAERGEDAAVALLLSKGAAVDALDAERCTPLMRALQVHTMRAAPLALLLPWQCRHCRGLRCCWVGPQRQDHGRGAAAALSPRIQGSAPSILLAVPLGSLAGRGVGRGQGPGGGGRQCEGDWQGRLDAPS